MVMAGCPRYQLKVREQSELLWTYRERITSKPLNANQRLQDNFISIYTPFEEPYQSTCTLAYDCSGQVKRKSADPQ